MSAPKEQQPRSREVQPFEQAAYQLGRRLVQERRQRVVQIFRREVHLPDGQILIEEQILSEEDDFGSLPSGGPSMLGRG